MAVYPEERVCPNHGVGDRVGGREGLHAQKERIIFHHRKLNQVSSVVQSVG
jgi:hypothetical protein